MNHDINNFLFKNYSNSKENPKTAELVASTLPKLKKSNKRRTPYQLFSDYNNLLGNKYEASRMREEYKNLSMEDAFKWVSKAVKMYPDVIDIFIITFIFEYFE